MLRSLIRLSGFALCAAVLLLLAAFFAGSQTSAATYLLLSAPDRETLETDLILYDARTGSHVRLMRDSTLRAAVPVPGSPEILLHQRESSQSYFRLLNPHTGSVVTILSGDIDTPRWSPDGRWLAYRTAGTRVGGLYIWDRATGESTRLLRRSPGVFTWSPDSERLLYVHTEGQAASLALVDRSGQQEILLALDHWLDLVDNLFWTDGGIFYTRDLLLYRVDPLSGEVQEVQQDDSQVINLDSLTLDLTYRYGWNQETYLAGAALLGDIPLQRFNVRSVAWARS
jgi:hypothetical protein